MARVRGGNTGFAVALVIFGCGFVIATLVAIIFYTKIETHKQAEQTAQDELAKYVSSTETGQANDYLGDGKTMFANMKAAINAQKGEIQKLTDQIARLNAEKSRMVSDFNALDTIKDEVEARLDQEREQFTSIMDQRQDQIDELIKEKDKLAAQVGELQAKVETAITNADEAAQTRIAELNTQVGSLGENKVELEAQIDTLLSAVEALRRQLPKVPEQDTTLPDGKIASVFENGTDMFIDLGRSNGLVLGMTFEVFPPDTIIRLSVQGEARGKATIEVYDLDAESATCRIVRRDKNAQIDPGDLIANIGYDPKMDVSMFAFGEFDIERNSGPNDIGRIQALIENSGADLIALTKNEAGIPILTPDIDYIVLGNKPEVPEKPGDSVFDPEVIKQYQAKLAEVEAYFKIVDEAKLLRIPVLNQDRFLQLVGYYVR